MSPARRSVPALAALLASAALAGCGGGGQDSAGAAYAALGDSASSGAGIAPIADDDCQRSEVNFAALVARTLDYASFEDASCAGATTDDLTEPQQLDGASNPPQLDVVGADTRLVTLTIGLNDDDLAYALFAACLSPTGTPSAVCTPLLQASEADLEDKIAEAADRVEDTLRLIEERAPEARIVLVGYPRFFPDAGSCPDRVPMVAAMVPRVRAAVAAVDEHWRQAADAVGADYVDGYALTEGHDVCAADPWVNGATAQPGEAAALHPFAAFHRAVADAIVARLKAS